MENNQRNSRKRLNSLILLVAFTAVMLIVSTYAWFSTQKNVTIKAIEGKVNVAEGLQISLDAKTWKNDIDLGVFYDSATGLYTNTSTEYIDEGYTLVTPYGSTPTVPINVLPTELLPVSTTGTGNFIGTGGKQTMNMYRGLNENGNELTEIALVDEMSAAVEPGYFAIDFFLQNSSATGVVSDELQLEQYSTLTLKNTNKTSTGLQNTVRVGLAFTQLDVPVDGEKGQTHILTDAAGKNITSVAIWEPNADKHVDYIKNNQRIAYTYTNATTPVWTTYGGAEEPAVDWKDQHITYAVNDTAVATGSDYKIANVYNWSTGDYKENKLSPQYTLQTSDLSTEGDPIPFVSAADGITKITINPNTYVKARMYIWLEGQDVDCINYASLGGGIKLDFGFSKPGSKTTTTN